MKQREEKSIQIILPPSKSCAILAIRENLKIISHVSVFYLIHLLCYLKHQRLKLCSQMGLFTLKLCYHFALKGGGSKGKGEPKSDQ